MMSSANLSAILGVGPDVPDFFRRGGGPRWKRGSEKSGYPALLPSIPT